MIELLGKKKKAPHIVAIAAGEYDSGEGKYLTEVALYKVSNGALVRMPAVSSFPTPDRASSVSLSPGGRYLALGINLDQAPYHRNAVRVYKRVGDNFIKLADPPWVPVPGELNSSVDYVTFSPDRGAHLLVSSYAGYALKRIGDSFSVLNDVFPTSSGGNPIPIYSAEYSRNAEYMVYDVQTGKRFRQRAGDTYTYISELVGLRFNGALSPDGVYFIDLGLSDDRPPAIFKRTGFSFAFLKSSSLPVPNLNTIDRYRSAAFSPDGQHIAISYSPYDNDSVALGRGNIYVLKWSGENFSTLLNYPILSGGANPYGRPMGRVSYSSDGRYLAVATERSPYMMVFERSGDSYTKLPDPSEPPIGSGRDSSFA